MNIGGDRSSIPPGRLQIGREGWEGAYASGLWSEQHALLIGQIITFWALVESQMFEILQTLVGRNGDLPTFKSVISGESKRKLLEAQLERMIVGPEGGTFGDDILARFLSLAGRRTDYADGIWRTYQDGQTAYLSVQSLEGLRSIDFREVTIFELETTLREMVELSKDLEVRLAVRLRAEVARTKSRLDRRGPRPKEPT